MSLIAANAKVVVGFNAREESQDALRLGQQLASSYGAELHVAVVLPRGAAPFEQALVRTPVATQLDEELYGSVTRQLEGVPFTAARLDGTLGGRSAARALYEYARDQDADLIVVGSTHRGQLGRVLPGSVGESLLRGSPCAVAVAPRGYAGEEARALERIGIAYDGSDEAERALGEGRGLAQAVGAGVRLITVVPPFAPVAVQGLQGEQIREAMRAHYSETLERGASALAGTDAEPVLVDGEPAQALIAQAEELDLLVLGSRSYGHFRSALLGATSAEVIRNAPCPVLVTPRASDTG